MSIPNRQPTVFHSGDGIWVNWFRHPLRYLATAAETDGKYCVSIGAVDLGQGASPHSHDFDEGFYILDGEVEFTAGNRKVLLGRGDFINVKAGTVHYPRGARAESSKMLVIAAPCGFDAFQIEVGGRIAGQYAVNDRTDDEMHSLVKRCAVKYGIDMNPTQAAHDAEPHMHVCRSNEGKLFDAVGDRYHFLAEAEHTGGAYAIWHATIAPGGGPPPHIHRREEEGFLVLSGELQFEADGQRLAGASDTFVNLPIGSKHRFWNSSRENAETLIFVAPGGLEKMFQHTGIAIEDAAAPVTMPTHEEKMRLIKVAEQFGIELD